MHTLKPSFSKPTLPPPIIRILNSDTFKNTGYNSFLSDAMEFIDFKHKPKIRYFKDSVPGIRHSKFFYGHDENHIIPKTHVLNLDIGAIL